MAARARLRGFLAAMNGASLAPAQALSAKFLSQNYKTFADIGTAQGMVPATGVDTLTNERRETSTPMSQIYATAAVASFQD